MLDNEAVEQYDSEERYYRDVILQIKQGKKIIYVYNKEILNKIQEQFENIDVKKKDFYWEITNNNEPFPKKIGRPRKGD